MKSKDNTQNIKATPRMDSRPRSSERASWLTRRQRRASSPSLSLFTWRY